MVRGCCLSRVVLGIERGQPGPIRGVQQRPVGRNEAPGGNVASAGAGECQSGRCDVQRVQRPQAYGGRRREQQRRGLLGNRLVWLDHHERSEVPQEGLEERIALLGVQCTFACVACEGRRQFRNGDERDRGGLLLAEAHYPHRANFRHVPLARALVSR